MATRTATQSGLWSDTTTWGGTVPVNGDAFNIPAGIVVECDVDQSGMATGMAASVIDGLLHFDADTNTCLKMNGNITGTGALYICERATIIGFTLTTGKTNTYQVSRSLDVATVEDTLGAGYLDAVEELIEVAIDVENAARVAQGLNEMMPDAVQTFIESTRASLTLSQILAYVEATQGSFYHDTVNDILYIHTSDSADPATHTMTVIEPINRPAAGDEYRALILTNSTATINVSVLRVYGFYNEREYTQLSENAESGQTQLKLNHDLNLQEGDQILVGSGTEKTITAEAASGIYTVSHYDDETKIVTVSSNLQTARLKDDYIARYSRPIKMSRSGGNNTVITAQTDLEVVGALVLSGTGKFYTVSGNMADAGKWKHSTANKYFFDHVSHGEISDCVLKGPLYFATASLNIKRTINMHSSGGYACGNYNNMTHITNLISQNVSYIPSITFKPIQNSIFKGFLSDLFGTPAIYKNCKFDKANNTYLTETARAAAMMGTIVAEGFGVADFVDCEFKGEGYFVFADAKLNNCIIEDDTNFVAGYNDSWRNPIVVESFDHNQLPGNYKAWMRGGKIETDTEDTTILPGRLILTCESADYPVFRAFPVLLPAHRTSTWQALTRKSFTGGSVQIELIDPANDPLIDPSAQPMATYSLPDTADTNLPLKLGYKSTVAMQAIIRVSAQNSTGTVEIDTRLIENRIQHGQ